MDNIMVSIIVPVYKVEKYIRQCINSILNQTYTKIELLLIDDGSPDSSGIICDEYANKDNRIRVFHINNSGVSAARNIGLRNIKGNYITFVDSDDWLEPDCIEKSLNIINKNNLDLLQYGYKRVDDHGNVLFVDAGEIPKLDAKRYIESGKMSINVWCTIFKTTIIRHTGLKFDENLKLGEDQLFIYKYLSECELCMRENNLFYNYRLNQESACMINNPAECIKSIKAFQTFELRSNFEYNIQNGILRHFLYPIISQRFLSVKKAYKLVKNENFNLLRPNRKFEHLFFKLYKVNRYLGILYLHLLLPNLNRK